jgi:AcrR family transcriptional regulator
MATATTARGPGRPPGADPRRPERLEAILDAACRAIRERGFPATRIADVAQAANVSTGTVHYYFATRDEVLIAALKHATDRLFGRVEEAGDAAPPRRLGHLLSVAVPRPGDARDEYVLWIELWLRVLHQPDLLPGIEGLSERWRGYFHAVVRAGVDEGDFEPVAGPAEVADRLVALADGMGFDTAVGYRWTSPDHMHQRLLAFAAEQLRTTTAALTGEAG